MEEKDVPRGVVQDDVAIALGGEVHKFLSEWAGSEAMVWRGEGARPEGHNGGYMYLYIHTYVYTFYYQAH